MPTNRKPLADLLDRETLIRMRQAGLTYAQIAQQVDRCERTLTLYAHKLLPPELHGKQPRRNDGQPATHYLNVLVCIRCHLHTEPRNPVDFVTRLCLWCRLDLAGINLPKAHKTGLYQRILAEETP